MAVSTNKNTASPKHFTVKDIFYGYIESEKLSWYITIDLPVTFVNPGTIKYNYLKLKNNESPNIFDRLFYELDIKSGDTRYMYLNKVIPFSLSVTSDNHLLQAEAISKLKLIASNGQPSARLFLDELDNVISTWGFTESIDNPTNRPNSATLPPIETFRATPLHKFYPATNDIWHQPELAISGINDVDDSRYYKGDSYVYDRFFEITPDGKDLVNDFEVNDVPTNPYTLAIAKATDALRLSVNELDNTKDRVPTLGYMVEKTCNLVGHRVDANGEIDKDKEKLKTRKILKSTDAVDEKQYGGNSFASEGMLMRRVPNYFDREKIESGGAVAINDLPQMLLEILDQINLGIGLQESGAIEINHNGQKHRYSSLLALVTEIAIHQFNQSQYARSTHISSLVTQEQTKEIIGGLGLPTVSKTLLRTANGNNTAIPFWGIAPQASIAKRIDTVAYNVGVVTGQVI